MSALSTANLSALMRTCRHLSEAALLPLCARSYAQLDSPARLASFHQFLRINSGPSSRTTYIKALWLDVPYEPSHSNEKSNLYLGILRYCRNVRRLRLSSNYSDIEPTLLFHVIATSLPALEELNLFVMPEVTEKAIHKLVRLPLLKLRLTGSLSCVPDALSAIAPLAATLVELDQISFRRLRPPPGGSFPGVKKLGVQFHDAHTFVETLTSTFPGTTHLTLLMSDTIIAPAVALGLRDPNRQRWKKVPPTVWRSLKAVWATNLPELHACGLVRHTAHLSVPFDFRTTSTHMSMLLDIVADMRPNSLEARIDVVSFVNRQPSVQFLETLEATLLSSARVTLRFGTFGEQSYDGATAHLMDAVENHLPKNGSLTHLLLRHVAYSGKAVQPEPARIPALAKASKAMRWIGIEVDGVLRCWEVTRPQYTDNTAQETVLVEMSEDAGRRLLASEQMDEFQEK
ncbi:hypothetical protein OH76DRAFT_502225 [Lentinus brumalis]|uniref:F-box domain-containing protein n=1 Tax=Lentinus brumalis TaxID=2498619 RepID=A0A371DBP7_9APHY|nr:hypothetical protein OH76DRAFT_502225 [Polyporus brumalis]